MHGKKLIFGLVLIVLGLALVARAADIIYFGFGDFLGVAFPIGLIALGIWLVVRRSQPREPFQANVHYQYDPGTGQTQGTTTSQEHKFTAKASASSGSRQEFSTAHTGGSGGRYKYEKFFGDIFVDCSGLNLQNIEVSIFIGDSEIKLHGGELARGLNRMVISGFIGDFRVLVPKGMPVFAQCSNFIGDIELLGRRANGFGNNIDNQTPNYSDAESRLYIAANVFIGDIHVYEV